MSQELMLNMSIPLTSLKEGLEIIDLTDRLGLQYNLSRTTLYVAPSQCSPSTSISQPCPTPPTSGSTSTSCSETPVAPKKRGRGRPKKSEAQPSPSADPLSPSVSTANAPLPPPAPQTANAAPLPSPPVVATPPQQPLPSTTPPVVATAAPPLPTTGSPTKADVIAHMVAYQKRLAAASGDQNAGVEAVRAILRQCGGNTISDVPEANYQQVITLISVS